MISKAAQAGTDSGGVAIVKACVVEGAQGREDGEMKGYCGAAIARTFLPVDLFNSLLDGNAEF